MHPVVKLCSLVLLSAAAVAFSLRGKSPVGIGAGDISPYQWAIHDWVPERNRRTDDRSMPIGAGELEPLPNQDQRRMHRRYPKRRKLRKGMKRIHKKLRVPVKRNMKNYHNIRPGATSGTENARNRYLVRRDMPKNIPLFPKDFERKEEKKFQLENRETKERLQYKGNIYLPVYKQVLDDVQAYKKKLDASRRISDASYQIQQEAAAKKLKG